MSDTASAETLARECESPVTEPAHLERQRHGERRTRIVVGLTFVMMIAEVGLGQLFHSMALVADGWHMGGHVAALGITLFAYWHARHHKDDPRFSFGTGKVGALGGFASGATLGFVALLLVGECVEKLIAPEPIRFDEALVVAVVGLVANLVSAWLLSGSELGASAHGHGHGAETEAGTAAGTGTAAGSGAAAESGTESEAGTETETGTETGSEAAAKSAAGADPHHDHGHDHGHGHGHGHHHGHGHGHGHGHHHGHGHGPVRLRAPAPRPAAEPHLSGHDHNLRAAYLHVLADALTSLLAIVALFAGRTFGMVWLDPVVGLVACAVIMRWMVNLLRQSAVTLLDQDADVQRTKALRATLESEVASRVVDLHVWTVAPQVTASMITLETNLPDARERARAIADRHGPFTHLTIEVRRPD